MTKGILIGSILVVAPSAAPAQARLDTGDRVRVVLERGTVNFGRVIEGTVVTIYPDTLTLRGTANGLDYGVDVHTIRELFGFAPRDPRRSARRGAQAGAFFGFGGGFVAGPLISSSYRDDNLLTTMALSSVAGLAAGALVGGAVGWLLASDGWQRYRLPEGWGR
jgi:hypothetical protein